MLPVDIPPGTTIESLVMEVLPALHARLVGDGVPDDPFSVAIRIERCGSWTARIRGRDMRVEAGEERRPTLWMCTTAETADHFLRDAVGPKRLLPRIPPAGAAQHPEARPAGQARAAAPGVLTLTDPRVIKRVAMVSGRIELAVVDEDGTRLAVVFGFGDAARRPIDPDRPEAVAEGSMETLERTLAGAVGPQDAIANGDVTVRGSRLLVMQLALAVAPFYLRST